MIATEDNNTPTNLLIRTKMFSKSIENMIHQNLEDLNNMEPLNYDFSGMNILNFVYINFWEMVYDMSVDPDNAMGYLQYMYVLGIEFICELNNPINNWVSKGKDFNNAFTVSNIKLLRIMGHPYYINKIVLRIPHANNLVSLEI